MSEDGCSMLRIHGLSTLWFPVSRVVASSVGYSYAWKREIRPRNTSVREISDIFGRQVEKPLARDLNDSMIRNDVQGPSH